jgi:arginine repressor
MAKGKLGTKSQAISEYLSANKEALPKQIVEALKEQGIEVSLGLANKVKYSKAKKKSARRAGKAIAAAKAQPVTTGSESIRQYLVKNPTAVTKEIITALHEKGIDVSESLVHKVKYRSSGKRAKTRQKRAFTSANSKKFTVMAKLKRGEKTQAVRDYLAKHPGATRSAVVEGLRAKGMKVKLTLVGSLMYKQASKTGKRRAPVVHAAARRTVTKGMSIAQLLEVKQFADSLGGADQIRSALDTLEQLR